jgi:putative membrane protein
LELQEEQMNWTRFGGVACAALLTVACADSSGPANPVSDANDRGAMQQPGSAGTSGDLDNAAGRRDRNVQEFVNEIARINAAEVQLGQLGAERAQNAEVKQFAQMMIKEHTTAGNELKQAVSAHNITVASNLDEKHTELIERLRGLRGSEFDREYMEAMVDGHEEARDIIRDRAGDRRMTTGTTGTSGSGVTGERSAAGSAAAGRSERTGQSTGTTGGAATGSGTSGAGTAAANSARLDSAVNQWATKTLPAVEQHLQKAEQLSSKIENNRNTGTSGNSPQERNGNRNR